MRIGAYAFVTIASGMLVSNPTRIPATIGDSRKLIVAAKKPSEKREENAARSAVRLSGNERGNIKSTSAMPIERPRIIPSVTRDIARLL
jgi:hypothetical protein